MMMSSAQPTCLPPQPVLDVCDTLDHLKISALTMNRFGCVTGHNEHADRLFSREFRIVGERLTIMDPSSAAAFANRVKVLHGGADHPFVDCEPIIVRRGYQAPLLLKIIPVGESGSCPHDDPVVLVVLKPVEPVRHVPADCMKLVFGLTASEARVAARLVGGATLRHAAADLGISVNTARVHLRIIFQKTGASRQSELVALMASLA